jgi:competence protein ComEA
MLDLFRLRHSDQWTVALVLAVFAGLLCGYTALGKRETFEPKQYRFRVDLNTATLGELQTLPGIGPKLADGIVQYRDTHAPIHDFDAILNVKGIGNKKHSTIKPYFTD